MGGLTISELLTVTLLVFFFPLFGIGVKLPPVPWMVNLALGPALAGLLFFVKRDRLPAAYWLGLMLPFWARQKRFLATRSNPRRAVADRIENSAGSGLNWISFAWHTAADGTPELHVYEDPRRPYRAVAARSAHERAQRLITSGFSPARRRGANRELLKELAR